jgi:hypothetical protein
MSPLTKLEIYGMQKTFHSNTLEPWYPEVGLGKAEYLGSTLKSPAITTRSPRHCAITVI